MCFTIDNNCIRSYRNSSCFSFIPALKCIKFSFYTWKLVAIAKSHISVCYTTFATISIKGYIHKNSFPMGIENLVIIGTYNRSIGNLASCIFCCVPSEENMIFFGRCRKCSISICVIYNSCFFICQTTVSIKSNIYRVLSKTYCKKDFSISLLLASCLRSLCYNITCYNLCAVYFIFFYIKA